MKNRLLVLLLSLIVVALVSCKHEDYKCLCCNLPYDYWSCEQLSDTTGLNLYPIEDILPNIPWDELMESSQIPEEYLRGMTTKALFYQCINSRVGSMFASCSHNCKELRNKPNMISEMLKRPDTGQALLEILSHITLDYALEKSECITVYSHLQHIIGWRQIINIMSDDEIEQYICQEMRIFEELIVGAKDPNASMLFSIIPIAIGFHNLLMRFEYEPYMANPLDDYYLINAGSWPLRVEKFQEIIEHIKEFLKNKKR